MLNLTEKLRSGHVRRWHIVAVAREQTVAEHMHRVGVITEEILRILGYFSWNSNLTLNAMRWAAIHDRPEFKLGDIPTPGKELIRESIASVYNTNGFDAIADAELSLEGNDPEYGQLAECVGPQGACPLAGHIVKLADLLEAMNYIGIFGCGSHARDVWSGLMVCAADQVAVVVKADKLEESPSGKERTSALFALLHSLMENPKQ